jgi:hypothetical protein
VKKQRTSGTITIAVLTIVLSSLILLNGLHRIIQTTLGVYELLQFGAIDSLVSTVLAVCLFVLPNILMFVVGIVGLVAGIGTFNLRPWVRFMSFVFGSLSVVSLVLPYVGVTLFDQRWPQTIGIFDLMCFCDVSLLFDYNIRDIQ